MIGRLFQKPRLTYQIEDYIAWREKRGMVCHNDLIVPFIKFCKKENIEDITFVEVAGFIEKIQDTIQTEYELLDVIKKMRCLFRYFKARKYSVVPPSFIDKSNIFTNNDENAMIHNTMEKRRVGRPADVKSIEQVRFLHDVGGLSISAIARAWNLDKAQISRWYNYQKNKGLTEKKLSTG